jgi:formate dehydrogenase subunit gamma
LIHVSRGVWGVAKTHRLPSIVPRTKDFMDTVQTVRHFLRGEPRPKLGRFDASEKFEYWGLFFGGMLMSVTGLALVFPEFVTRFLPGIVVAAMRTMHGLEATFAVLVVLLWHSYGVIFKPDVFPLDTSIFTGKISIERLKEEHELEYEKLFPERAGAD